MRTVIWIIAIAIVSTIMGIITNFIGGVVAGSATMCFFFFSRMQWKNIPQPQDLESNSDAALPDSEKPFDIHIPVRNVPDTLCVVPNQTEQIDFAQVLRELGTNSSTEKRKPGE